MREFMHRLMIYWYLVRLNSVLKSKDHFANKGPYTQRYGLSSSHVWMWELDHKEDRVLKYYCFWTVLLESPLDYKEIKPVNFKGNQSWVLIGRTDAEAEVPILWPPAVTGDSLERTLRAGKNWRQKENRVAEDDVVGLHHWLNGREFGQTPGDGEEQGSLACCSPWGLKDSYMTWRLNNNN